MNIKHVIKASISLMAISTGLFFVSAQTIDVDTSSASSCAIISANLRYLSRDTSSSSDVSILQDFLNSKGYLKSQPTGFFGAATRRAVIAFQNDNGLRATPPGYVGAGTRAKIQAIDCSDVSATNTNSVQVTNPAVSTDFERYTNNAYGFSIDFSKNDPAQTTGYGSLRPFSSNPVVYSPYWITVNVSDKEQDIKNCTVPGMIHNASESSMKLNKTYTKTINGTAFAVSDWSNVDSYERNYTTLHNDKCFDVQIITIPSCSLCNSGRPSLESYKSKLDAMDVTVQSFRFILPLPSTAQDVSVDGMTKYLDSNFGFSFWHPTKWKVEEITTPQVPAYTGGTVLKQVTLSGGDQKFTISEFRSSSLAINISAGACGYCGPVTYSFDKIKHLWMKTADVGGDVPESARAQLKLPQPADISNNTIGGLHMFKAGQRNAVTIVPISARDFIIVENVSGTNKGDLQSEEALAKTIIATDPSVGVHVSANEQTQVIKNAYSVYGK